MLTFLFLRFNLSEGMFPQVQVPVEVRSVSWSYELPILWWQLNPDPQQELYAVFSHTVVFPASNSECSPQPGLLFCHWTTFKVS